jgi:hypothetical protein
MSSKYALVSLQTRQNQHGLAEGTLSSHAAKRWIQLLQRLTWLLKSQMFDRLPVIDQLLKRIDADAQVHFQILLRDFFVTLCGFDAAADHGLVRDQ